jgi:Putative restriction endonuclease
VSVCPWPDHLLSLDEWAALPADNTRQFELTEGVLRVSPRPTSDHQRALGNLFRQLDEQLPADLVALIDVEVVLTPERPATVLVPDLVVVPTALADANPARFSAADVLLAVEVVWLGSREVDHVEKKYDYSAEGVPSYWILGTETPVVLTAYQLIDSKYEIAGQGTKSLALSEPAPVTVNVAGLLPHRA